MKTNYLGNFIVRENLKKSIKRIIEISSELDVNAVVALELSGRPVGYFFDYGWEKLFPKKKKPKIMFMSPDIFEKEIIPDDYEGFSKSQGKKIKKYFKRDMLNLYNLIMKNATIMVLDEFSCKIDNGQLHDVKQAILSVNKNVRVYSASLVDSLITPSSSIDIRGVTAEFEPPWYHNRDWVTRETNNSSLVAKLIDSEDKENLLKEELRIAANELK